ncbi:Epi-isozizaene 5-monooxygenase/(E)-beta-farnesene synthase [Posidoniimonas polymericola]|uniref:Epi-isozizaene 5-monooxygenase/(E)-beta-farnesene synthase n=1 Tax=Posidoniimonas polymericola TaxID=2528002 RepID=A0A5C5ZFI0_9BACT|nr:cytochrome P450 [Posidoniimonas polymericola]TWT85865.1 Epi-isozizaene 5-monooxygenase/(E)-beta-farnesene synthase [Posidoniimonas polymericola]
MALNSAAHNSTSSSGSCRSSHPPGPANYNRWLGLTWRHVASLWRQPLQYPLEVAHQHGGLSSFLLLSKRVYIVNHPRVLHEFMVHRRADFVKAPWQTRVMRQVLGDGLLLSEGELWLRQRRLIQQAFRGGAMDRYAQITVEETERSIDAWRSTPRIDLVDEMTALTMSLSIRSTVGCRPEGRDCPSPAELAEAVIEGADILKLDMENPLSPPDWAPLPSRRRKREVIGVINRYVAQAIADRRAAPTAHDDLLALLLRSVDVEGDGLGMSERLARDEVVTMLLAGSHASSATLGWFWKLVLGKPDVHRRLVEEVDQVLGGRRATIDDLPRLAYVRQTLQETLRLFPSAWVLFCRQAVRSTTLDGYRLRRGAWVFAYPFATHRDPRFFADPLRFDPERFSPERTAEMVDGAYFPFGHGPRNCIGQHMAMLQLTLIVATVLQRLRLEPTSGCDDLAIRRELSIRPATPCVVAPRVRAAAGEVVVGWAAATASSGGGSKP